ncbi:hypothetical protein DFH06DRAFT_1301971 [Mycena polygramma]|nr:hypothetical protein DFH06DRAFT_1301971 [Mycena polygramma]
MPGPGKADDSFASTKRRRSQDRASRRNSRMPSVEEMRARVTRLSTEIGLHKELLKKLERDRYLVQRQLDIAFNAAALDPVSRHPLEISSEIFLQSLPENQSFPQPGVQHVPMLFLNICHAWITIALSTPALWAAIQVTVPCVSRRRFTDGLQAWLERACNHPLSVSLHGSGELDPDATDIIWQRGAQLKHLELCYREEKENKDERDEGTFDTVDLLGGNPGPLPSLQTLAIRGSKTAPDRVGYSGVQILELLRLAPNLLECSFDRFYPLYDYMNPAKLLVVLPALRRLSIKNPYPYSDDQIFKCLSLPELEAFSVSLRGHSLHDMISFFQRSSPPLRELVLKDFADAEATPLHEYLSSIPTLTYFEVWQPRFPLLAKFFERLTLLRALAERHDDLRVVHIGLESETCDASWMPTAKQVAAFREMVLDGMEIYIGTKKLNITAI